MAESGVALVRRMLWNREVGKPSRPVPMIILLGPVGSGKTHALNAISKDLSWGVVHARFDFSRDDATVEVLKELVDQLSGRWRNRPKPQFLRFAIALLAIELQLDGHSRAADREKFREELRGFRRFRWTGELDNLVAALAEGVRSLPDFPQVDGVDPLDALVTVNRLAHRGSTDTKALTAWLLDAFLADVRKNHRRMSAVEPKSPCACANPGKVRHVHNWVLLLDNIHTSSGTRFLADLVTARESYLFRHPEDPEAHDALQVVATSGRWQQDWNSAWRPVWQPEPEVQDKLRTVPAAREASYENWANPAPGFLPSPYYPVVLDTLPIGEIAKILRARGPADPKVAFVFRASGGLPGAVSQLATILANRIVVHGARDVLAGAEWDSWLKDLRLTDHLSGVDIRDFVTMGPFATAPWLIRLPAEGAINQAQIGRILYELRTALWVSARDPGGGVTDHVVLHPWLATNLLSALTHRENGAGPSYTDQFTALLRATDTEKEPMRSAYCRLALGEIGAVVSLFEQKFDRWRHQEWVDRLRVVVQAPDNLATDKNYDLLYEELVNADIEEKPHGRGEVRNNVARLVAACWLTANPRSARGPSQHKEIANAFESLLRMSQLPDVRALHDAAELARRGLLP
jgi:hypothetical protein